MSTRTFRLAALLTAVVALLVPLAAAGGDTGSKPRAAHTAIDALKRDIFATDDRGKLLPFGAAFLSS